MRSTLFAKVLARRCSRNTLVVRLYTRTGRCSFPTCFPGRVPFRSPRRSVSRGYLLLGRLPCFANGRRLRGGLLPWCRTLIAVFLTLHTPCILGSCAFYQLVRVCRRYLGIDFMIFYFYVLLHYSFSAPHFVLSRCLFSSSISPKHANIPSTGVCSITPFGSFTRLPRN